MAMRMALVGFMLVLSGCITPLDEPGDAQAEDGAAGAAADCEQAPRLSGPGGPPTDAWFARFTVSAETVCALSGPEGLVLPDHETTLISYDVVTGDFEGDGAVKVTWRFEPAFEAQVSGPAEWILEPSSSGIVWFDVTPAVDGIVDARIAADFERTTEGRISFEGAAVHVGP